MPACLSLSFLRTGLILALGILIMAPMNLAANQNSRTRLAFNDEWRFIKDDPVATGEQLTYANVKAWMLPCAQAMLNYSAQIAKRPKDNPFADMSYIARECDDSHWQPVTLPHDWGISGPFKQEYPGETGKLPWWGVGWYRKHFDLPMSDADKRIYLDVDGAMSYAMVWLNGQPVGGWPYGYSSWRLDLTPFVHFGGANTLAIRLDNPKASSRWYPGGGLYRNVWLVKTSAVHVAHWGTFVTTPMVINKQAHVDVQTIVQNTGEKETTVQVISKIYEIDADDKPQGSAVAVSDTITLHIAAKRQATGSHGMMVNQPKLWSLQKPQRYTVVTLVEQQGQVVDEYHTPFGIRTIAFQADNGFFLNGDPVKLNGVCMHHDLGALGSAVNRRALQRQIEILQEMGCNAIRTSHNPPAPELLELCDKMGLVVMDEAFDCWREGKTANDYHLLFTDWHEADLRALIRRDRNHPCVVLWSIGNEVPDQWQPEGWKLAEHMAAIAREEDRTRPITSGYNNLQSGYNGFQKAVDVMGYNYKPAEYGVFHQRNPYIPILGSETSSCISSRGEYFFPVLEDKAEGRCDFQMSSYDLYAPPWAFPPDIEFRGLDEFPFTAGEFVWTGFDYLGEPTPYGDDVTNVLNVTDPLVKKRLQAELQKNGKLALPSRSSYFGIVDLAGFKKDRFYIYQARWRPDLPMAHILPHWNWPERVGQMTPVHVYTSGDEAELFLNGKSLGRKTKAAFEYRLRWDEVIYQPGELRVQAFKNHKPWAEDSMVTAGPAAGIKMSADRIGIQADGQDLCFVTVAIVDKKGRTVPRSNNPVQYKISGPGIIKAVDNGNATSHASFQDTKGQAYNGLALVIVRSIKGQTGVIRLEAASVGLKGLTIAITSRLN